MSEPDLAAEVKGGAGGAAAKFHDPHRTATGEERASVGLVGLRTLWINTGTLCNLTCANCYIESSPTNDRLSYIRLAEVQSYLDEIEHLGLGTEEIGFTGGEPFMNPEIVAMIEDCLGRGYRCLVLSNAGQPMARLKPRLLDIKDRYGARLVIRVSLDHYGRDQHDRERGEGNWAKTLDGLQWLSDQGFAVHVAGRTCWDEDEDSLRRGFAAVFAERGIAIDAFNGKAMVLFPEMDLKAEVPEITAACWATLGVSPADMMCATSRMVVKRKGASSPVVVSCTLLPYDQRFEMGESLADARGKVRLNHPHCAKFCVLGGGSCSAA